jgi:hypothetical protein
MRSLVALLIPLLAGAALAEPVEVRLPLPRTRGMAVPFTGDAFPRVRRLDRVMEGDVDERRTRSPDRAAIEAILGAAKRGIVSFDSEDGLLRLRGAEASVRAFRDRWSEVLAFVAGRARLSVALYGVPRGDVPPGEGAKAAAAWRREHAGSLLWTGRFETTRGETVELSRLAERTIVHELNTEVAQYAAIGEPKIAKLATGRRVAVQCRPVSRDEAAVLLSVHRSQPDGPQDPVTTATGSLDLPVVRFVSLVTSLRVRVGQTRTLLVDDLRPGRALVVLVTLESQDVPETALVDRAALRGQPELLDLWRPAGVSPEPDPEGGPSGLVEATEGALSRLLARPENVLHDVTPLVALAASPERAAALREIPERGVLTRRVRRLPWSSLVRAPWFDAATGAVDVEGLAADAGPSVESRLSAPLHAATPLLVQRGVWRRVLAGLSCEIAQGAAILGPVAMDLLDGESVLAVLRPEGIEVVRSTFRLRDLGRGPVEIRRDIDGRRTASRGHRLDRLRGDESRTRLLLGEGGLVDLRREGDDVVIEVWGR